MVRRSLRERNPLRDNRIEDRRREIWFKKERRKDPQPLPLEKRARTIVGGRNTVGDTDDPPNPRKPPRYPRRARSHNSEDGRDTRPKPTDGRRRYFTVLHPRIHRPDPNKHGRSTGSDRRRRRNESHKRKLEREPTRQVRR